MQNAKMLRICAVLIAIAMTFTSVTANVSNIYADTDTTKLTTNKSVYDADDPILVTASGNATDLVGLYKYGESASDEPIYSYEVGGETGGIKHKSGAQYDIRAYGVVNPRRLEDAKLPAGEYAIILSNGAREVLRKNISIIGTSAFDGKKMITTNKTHYKVGEDIIVTASGTGNDWVGIYKKGNRPGLPENGGSSSICWYYVSSENQVSGKPFILQKGEGITNANTQLSEGEYYIVLMENDGYNELARVDNIVIQAGSVEKLESVTYNLENQTDGFANGTVTITKKDGANLDACLLYWGDTDGTPLKGYSSLMKVKLTGNVTGVKMQANTIIPPEAKTLIAYGLNNNKRSDEAVAATLPAGAAYQIDDISKEKMRFVAGSDLHLVNKGKLNEVNADTNYHFELALKDIVTNFPGAAGFFANGDITDDGVASQFNEAVNIIASVEGAPKLHMAIGNHDWYDGNPNRQFQKYVNMFNPAVKTETVYYDEWVDGYHFIYLGSEIQGHFATLSNEQLTWLNQLLAADAEANPEKPVFVFLHQGLQNSMAGNFVGQWGNDSAFGVAQDKELRAILQKYGQVVLFGGHTHYVLDSDNSVTPGSDDLPVCVNTAAVGYLWDDFNIASGEYKEGSEGYFVQVFENKVYMFGRNFITGEYVPSAMYVLDPAELAVEHTEITMHVGDNRVSIGAKTEAGMQLTYKSSNNNVASVDYNGHISAIGAGTAKIYVSTNSTNTKTINRKIITVTVKNADESYSIAYKDENGNILTGLSPSAYTYYEAKQGEILLPQTVNKHGYQLDGWYTNQSFSGSPITAIPKDSSGNKLFYGKWTPISYTITYKDGGNTLTGLSPTSYTIESGTITLPTPTKQGYTFQGWYDDASDSMTSVIPQESTGHKSYSAKFRINSYAVSFDTRGGSPVPEQSVAYNTTATKPSTAPTKTGYTFEGWVTEAGEPYDFTTKITKDTTIYARWSECKYTVTFNSMGGSAIEDEVVTYGQHVKVPANPMRDGYTFCGWAVTADGTNMYDFSNSVTTSFTVYAKWTPIVYKIFFMSNGGTSVEDMEYNIESETIAFPTISKEGYTFGGWYMSSDCSGNAVTDVSKGSMGTKILYAKWIPLSYKVTFDTNGGSATEPQFVFRGKTVAIPKAPTKEGYTFAGWEIASGEAFSFETPITRDITIYAKWNRNAYIVHFDTDGGSFIDYQSVLYEEKAVRPEKNPTKLAYSFEGWVTSKGGDIAFDFNQPITGETTIYAKWNLKDKYTVSFVTGGGTSIEKQSVQEGKTAIKPAEPERKGYAFVNWYKDAALTEKFSFSDPIMDNTNIYAKWMPISYTITYDTDGGVAVSADTYTIETASFALPTTTKDGYHFLGWSTSDGTSYTRIEHGTTGNLELIARWQKAKILAVDKKKYDFKESIYVTTNYAKAGAWVGLYKEGELPGKDNFILKYNVPAGEAKVELYNYKIIEQNGNRNEFYKNTGRLKSGEYKIYIFKDDEMEILDKNYFFIATEIDGKPEITMPTCTQSGITVTQYTDGTVVKSDSKPPLGHDMVPATCDKKSFCQRENCDYEIGLALGHNMKLVREMEASCTEDGNIRYYACGQCSGYFGDENGATLVDAVVIPAHGHTMIHHNQVDPTCEEDGSKAYYHCTACNQHFEDKSGKIVLDSIVITKTGHVEGEAATCTQPQRCVVCKDELKPALGHMRGAEATCTTNQNCTTCGVVLVKALGHTAGEEPTCTTAQTCVTCNELLVDAFGHTPKKRTLCTDKYQCSVCNKVLADGNDHVSGAEATCTTPQRCLKCNYIMKELRPHDFSEATCQTPQTCRNCGKTRGSLGSHLPDRDTPTCTEGQRCTTCKEMLSKAKGHVKGLPATCTTAQHCKECKIELVPPLGHLPGKEATCEEPQKCLECQIVLAEADPLLHKPGALATCTEDQVCTYCKKVLEEAHGHTESIVSGKAATCMATGLTDGKICAICMETLEQRDIIPAKGHTAGAPATCQSPQRCTDCQAIIEGTIAHKLGPAATCLTPQKCIECDKVIVAAKGHNPGPKATCATNQVCKDCNTVLSMKLGHIWIKGNCTVDTTCRRCDDRIAAPGHVLIDLKAVESTCWKTGLTAGKKCNICGEITVAQKITEKKEHQESVISGKVPTCTESGLTEGRRCMLCHVVTLQQKEIPMQDHQGESTVTAASKEQDGEILEYCSKCNIVLSQQAITAIDTIKLSCSTYVYNGLTKAPTITVKDRVGNIISDGYYTVSVPEGRKNVGSYNYTITFKGNYTGTSTLKMTIKPAKPSWLRLRGEQKAVTVKWKKVNKQATGYQIMIATNKAFTKNVKKAFVTKKSTTSKKMTGLKAKKTYYVRVRTYKTVKGVKIYSAWSTVKKVKTK